MYVGKLNSNSNIVDTKIFSGRRRGCKRVGDERRCFRLYGLFGGKKDEKSDDAPSKVS